MKRREHREEKWEFPFVAYSCDETEKKLPLIIQLHGAGERGNGQGYLFDRLIFQKKCAPLLDGDDPSPREK